MYDNETLFQISESTELLLNGVISIWSADYNRKSNQNVNVFIYIHVKGTLSQHQHKLEGVYRKVYQLLPSPISTRFPLQQIDEHSWFSINVFIYTENYKNYFSSFYPFIKHS